MHRATSGISSLTCISSYLIPRSYHGVSSLMANCAPLCERRGGIIGRHGSRIASQIHYPYMLLARNVAHSIPCNMTGSGRMLTRSEDPKSNKTFVVRHANSLDDLQWVTNQASEEGWMPYEREAECCFTAGLTSDFFIGELNGERISSVSFMRHEDSLFFGGHLIVLKSYRGKGYGQKMWDTAVASLGDQYTIHGSSVLNIKDVHTIMNLPTRPGWILRRYTFDVSQAREGLASCQFPPSLAQIVSATQADFGKVFAYSADMLGSSQTCKLMLAARLSHTQDCSWVAIGNRGEVVGYLILGRTIRFPEEGYRITPFYADSAPIARSLLKVAVEFAAANNPRQIFLDIAADLNPEGASILENEIGAKQLAKFVTLSMGAKGIPSKPQYKVFSAISL